MSSGEVVAAPVAPPRLREATFEDYPRIHQVESAFFGDSLPPDTRRGLFEGNPLWPRLRDSWPIGWVLEDDAGALVGSLNNIPSAYRLAGQELICANGHCWAVLGPYRGYATMLMDEYFSQAGPDLIVSAKVGAEAAPVWEAYADRVPVGDWSTAAFAITGYRGFARAGLDRKRVPAAAVLAPPLAVALRVKDGLSPNRLPPDPAGYEFAEVDRFDQRFDTFWDELAGRYPQRLLGVRDAATLTWHYAIPAGAGRVSTAVALRDGAIRAYCVLKQHVRPDGARSMKLVDVQTLDDEPDLLPGLLRVALRRSRARGCSFLEHHGLGLPKTRAFDRFARYRVGKPSWSFYYYTQDPALAQRLADPGIWDPSEFDGDSSYK